jgi:hypothetical protein
VEITVPQFENDVNFMAERMRNTDVRFVNFFRRHGKALVNGTRGVLFCELLRC